MERKLDSDIEQIRDVLLSGTSKPVWNKQDVWARIEEKESKKRVWPFAFAACVALISLFIFWKTTPEKTAEMASLALPKIQNEAKQSVPLNKEAVSNATVKVSKNNESVEKQAVVKPEVLTLAKSAVENAQKDNSLGQLVAINPKKISRLETDLTLAGVRGVAIKSVALPNKMLTEHVAIKEAVSGKKITLIIPEEDKEGVRSNVKVVRFIQKVGEYNRTGEWEPEKKNKIGELWVKFLESTKTNEKSKL